MSDRQMEERRERGKRDRVTDKEMVRERVSAYKFHTLLPQDFEAQARFLFHGSTHNRWFDKCVNLVVSSSGTVGANVEHSALDATVRRGVG